MTLTRAFITVAVSTVVCTVAGVGLGIFVGYVAPDFYAMSYRGGLPPGIDPVQIGIGNGVNGGAFCGIAIGLVIVAIVAYGDFRRHEAQRIQIPNLEKVSVPAFDSSSEAVQRRQRQKESEP